MTQTTGSEFFGAVLTAIACTRNNGPDGDAYDQGVVEPARRIRALEEETTGRGLTTDETERVLGWLETILDTKRVPDAEREYHRDRVSRAGGLTVVMRGTA
ncbi:hypothetical protein [Nocardiopsis sp. LOL_012]|uniref:hypothetical protein n=1 Tax=Nocardiopsis sp. LOL_012 TaxID=3345409 RepID=UPI003A856FEC